MYDSWADHYDIDFQNKRYKAAEKLVSQFNIAAKDLHILDIGIGTGMLAERFKKQNPDCHITGIDISKEMLKECRKKQIADELIQIDFQKEGIPFEDGEFDLVVSSGVFELLNKPDKVIKEMARVLKPSGEFAFTVYADSSDGYNCNRHPDELINGAIAKGQLTTKSREHFTAFKHEGSNINYHLYTGVKQPRPIPV